MNKIIKSLVPSSFKKKIKNLLLRQFEKHDVSSKELKYCSVCQKESHMSPLPNYYFDKYFEHGFVHSPFLFETLNLKYYRCNNCGASDRDRLIALYFRQFLEENNEKVNMLDFAPSQALRHVFQNDKSILYRSADLFMDGVDDRVDIRNMNIYDDNAFDIFVCSHVLEHIDEDLKAMHELKRILKANGFGLILVPVLLSLSDSIEDKAYLESEHLRWKYFGQDDHVRIYSKKDLVSRLESVGFKVEQLGIDFFGERLFFETGIDFKSVLYLVKHIND